MDKDIEMILLAINKEFKLSSGITCCYLRLRGV